jgi:hypothetical protein
MADEERVVRKEAMMTNSHSDIHASTTRNPQSQKSRTNDVLAECRVELPCMLLVFISGMELELDIHSKPVKNNSKPLRRVLSTLKFDQCCEAA